MKTPNNLIEFAMAILENGGSTFNLKTGHVPNTGIAVSLAGFEDSHAFTDQYSKLLQIENHVKQYVKTHGFKLEDEELYLGGWIEGNSVVLDISEVFENEKVAVREAVLRNQRAIYDLDNDKEFKIQIEGQACGTETQKESSTEANIRYHIDKLKAQRRNLK